LAAHGGSFARPEQLWGRRQGVKIWEQTQKYSTVWNTGTSAL